ncbi:MAG: NUDIX hydrolase [Thermoanaerobaculia bacterium]
MKASFSIGLNAVILAVTGETPRVLTVTAASGEPALPFGQLEPESERTLELALRHRVRELTGLELGYVEQLYTFGDRDRDPAVRHAGVRPISIGYLALVREGEAAPGAAWEDVYRFLPWEDHRSGSNPSVESRIAPALTAWADAGSAACGARTERVEITFGLGGSTWDGDRVLDRLELLYEARLVAEAVRDRRRRTESPQPPPAPALGEPMALDHRRMLATALGRIRGKIRYRPIIFEMLPEEFTLLRLQRTVEALAGVRLHKGNFRRLVDRGGMVVGTGRLEPHTGGRPAELFRFRREVLRERRAPGVGLPRAPA